jgi:hypothetical protein
MWVVCVHVCVCVCGGGGGEVHEDCPKVISLREADRLVLGHCNIMLQAAASQTSARQRHVAVEARTCDSMMWSSLESAPVRASCLQGRRGEEGGGGRRREEGVGGLRRMGEAARGRVTQ